MPQFMMLLHDSTTAIKGMSPDEIQRVVQRYNEWAGRVAQAGKLHGGNKLRDEPGLHLSKDKGVMIVRDGPFVEGKEILGGYFIVEAADYQDATALCTDCPHLDLGGRIELRQVDVV